MSAWGRKSLLELTGTATIEDESTTVTGTGTEFTTEVKVADVLDLDGTSFVVRSITSDTVLIVTTAATATITDSAILLSEMPTSVSKADIDAEVITFVEVSEAITTENRALGIKTPGWTRYETYGDGRKRVETLVAMKNTG